MLGEWVKRTGPMHLEFPSLTKKKKRKVIIDFFFLMNQLPKTFVLYFQVSTIFSLSLSPFYVSGNQP